MKRSVRAGLLCLVVGEAASPLSACGGRSIAYDDQTGGVGSRAGAAATGGSASASGSAGGSKGGRAGSSTGGAAATGGSDSGGRAQGGNAQAGTSNVGGASAGGTGFGGGPDCSSFDDDFALEFIVTIENKSNAVVQLGSLMNDCTSGPVFSVTDEKGQTLPDLGNCRAPCEALMDGGGLGCPAICALPNAVTLAPGATYKTVWSGLQRVQERLPVRCAPKLSASELTCDRAELITVGAYTFSVVAGTTLDCQSTLGGPCPPCGASPSGTCVTPAALLGPPFKYAKELVRIIPAQTSTHHVTLRF